MSKTGLSCHSGAAKRRSRAPSFEAVSRPIIWPQVSRPLAQASAPAVISAAGSDVGACPGAPQPNAGGKAPHAGGTDGQGWPCFSPSAQVSMSICWARPMTHVQCCQSSSVGIALAVSLSSAMAFCLSLSPFCCESQRLHQRTDPRKARRWNPPHYRKPSSCSTISGSPCSQFPAPCSRPSASRR